MKFFNSSIGKDVNFNSKFKQINLYINELAVVDILKDKKIDVCPHCNCDKFIKYGKYKGLQRYKCINENCLKTFSKKTNSIFSNSKKPLDFWIKYLVLMNNNMSLRDCSSILGINLATSFYWRHKILSTQAKNNDNILKNYVEISKIIIKENFKGDRNAKNYDKENIFVACAMDSNEIIVSKAISRRSISLAAIDKNFSKNLDKSAIISSYNDRYFEIYAKKHNNSIFPVSHKIILDLVQQLSSNNLVESNILSFKNINKALPSNSIFLHKFSLNIKKWLVRFRGVATKYLENYLNWHIIDFKYNYETYLLNQLSLFKNLALIPVYMKIKNFADHKLMYQFTANGNY